MTQEEKINELIKVHKSCFEKHDDIRLRGNQELIAIESAIITCKQVLSIVPMYKGNLNPTWRSWNELCDQLERMRDKILNDEN